MTITGMRRNVVLCLFLLPFAAAGCGTSLSDLLGGLLGGNGDSGGSVYFIVYNFYSHKVEASVSFLDKNGQRVSHNIL